MFRYLEVERVVCGGAIVDIFEFFLLHTKEPTDATVSHPISSLFPVSSPPSSDFSSVIFLIFLYFFIIFDG